MKPVFESNHESHSTVSLFLIQHVPSKNALLNYTYLRICTSEKPSRSSISIHDFAKMSSYRNRTLVQIPFPPARCTNPTRLPPSPLVRESEGKRDITPQRKTLPSISVQPGYHFQCIISGRKAVYVSAIIAGTNSNGPFRSSL